jgi:sugar lactone lactonase YvrE
LNPRTGEVLSSIHLPGAKNITSCCFGGPNLTTLYITTAREDTDTGVYAQAGGLFSYEFTDGTAGFAPNKFTIRS